MASDARSRGARRRDCGRPRPPSRRTGATPSSGGHRPRSSGRGPPSGPSPSCWRSTPTAAGGATEVGVVALVRVLPAAVVAPLATQYADRWPREKVLVAVSARCGPSSIALAGWAVYVDGPAVTVYALVTVSSAAAVLFRPVHSALLPSLCDTPPELAGANVVRGALDSAATLAGPAISAVLLATGGPAQALAVAAVASAWAGWLMARVHPEPTPLDDGRLDDREPARTGAGWSARGPRRPRPAPADRHDRRPDPHARGHHGLHRGRRGRARGSRRPRRRGAQRRTRRRRGPRVRCRRAPRGHAAAGGLVRARGGPVGRTAGRHRPVPVGTDRRW